MDDAGFEESLIISYPVGAMRTANGDLVFTRQMVKPRRAVPLQGGRIVVEKQTPPA